GRPAQRAGRRVDPAPGVRPSPVGQPRRLPDPPLVTSASGELKEPTMTDRPTRIAIAMYDRMTMLDAIGPYQVLTWVPGVEVLLVGTERGRITDDQGLLHVE